MNHKSSVFILFLSVISMAVSCRPSVEEAVFADVRTYIDDSPDSALTVLEGIRPELLTTKKLKGEYSLLLTMALDKNYVDTADLSIIEPALQYYSSFGNRRDKALANLYYARILINGGDCPKATKYLNKSLKYVNKEDYKTKILIYSSLNYAYNNSFNDEDALMYSKLIYENTLASGDTSGYALALYNLALAHHNNHDFSASDSLCSAVFEFTDSLSEVALETMRLQADNTLDLAEPDYAGIVRKYEFISENGGLSTENLYNFAYALLQSGDSEYADIVLTFVDTVQTTGMDLFRLARVEELKGEWRRALEHYEKYMEFEEVYVKDALAQSLYRAQLENYRLQSELDAKSRRMTVLTGCIVILCLIVICFTIYFIYRKRNTILRSKNEELARSVAELKALRKTYMSVYCANLNSSDYKSGSVAIAELRSRLDHDLDGVITKIIGDFPALKASDIDFLCCMMAGFTNIEITTLLNLSKQNVRTKRYRLKTILLKSSGPNQPLYSYVLGK